MTSAVRPLVALALLAALSACGSGSSEPQSDATTGASAKEDTCVEVRAGIDAFNDQDYAGTVDHFRDAKTLAQRNADSGASNEADDLLEAVLYYAALAPADYPEAARSSADFARYKKITLGQCMAGDPGTIT